MIFFDTHIHLTDFKDTEPKDLVTRLHQSGVEKCVCVTAQPSDWPKVAKLTHDFSFEIVPSFGLHPWYAANVDNGWQESLEGYLKEFEGAVIGECGFDGLKSINPDKERKVFEVQLELAFEYKRPMMLHMVKSDAFLEKYWGRMPEKSVFHSFSGSKNILKKILNFNHYISVNKRFFNKKDAEDILKYVPIEKLLIETDAPFQSDISDLEGVVNKIAAIKNEKQETLAQKLYLNALKVLVEN